MLQSHNSPQVVVHQILDHITDGLLNKLKDFVHNVIHINMYFVINVSVDNYCYKVNVVQHMIVYGLLVQLQILVHVLRILAMFTQFNNNVHKYHFVFGMQVQLEVQPVNHTLLVIS
jgi:hypothetical protein